MNKINNRQELRKEIVRLNRLSLEQKNQIKSDLHSIKENLTPSGILSNLVSGFTGIKVNKENFIRDGFVYTVSLLIQQFFLKSEKKFEAGVYGIIDKLIDKLRSAVNNFSSHEARKRERD